MTQGTFRAGRGCQILFATLLILGVPLSATADNLKIRHFSNDPNADKISVHLLNPSDKFSARHSARRVRRAPSSNVPVAQPQVLDVVLNEASADVENAIRQIKGVEIRHFSRKYQRASVSVSSPSKLFELARLPAVRSIRPEYGAITQVGSVDSLADQALRADLAKSDYGLDGAGQTVGILSDSFAAGPNRDGDTSPPAGVAGLLTGSPAQDSGDLPATVSLLQDLPFGSDEGAAMAELVHDLAPGADIAFNTAFVGGQAGFADGIDRLCAQSTVLVDDVIYLAEPMYQQGIVAQAAADCVASGVPYFSSAGNQANQGLVSRYQDIDPAHENENFPATGEDLHAWSPGQAFLPVKLLPGTQVTAVLQWNQPFDSVHHGAGAQVDMDLYVTSSPTLDASGANVVAAGIDLQGNTGQPAGDALEIVTFSNFQPQPQTLYLSIDHYHGRQDVIPQDDSTPLEFRIVFYVFGQAEIEGIADKSSAQGGPTIYGHATAPGVVSVAAAPFFDTPAFGTNDSELANNTLVPGLNLFAGAPSRETAAIDPEIFSSRGGPLTVYFGRDGRLAPVTSFEPDITAVDGNDTSFFGADVFFSSTHPPEPDGFKNFFGTSAAAPNAAAVAALLQQWQSRPGETDSRPARSYLHPLEVTRYLQDTAIDITGYRAAPGVDDVTGPGLIDTVAALRLAVNHAPDFHGGPDITVCKNAGNQYFPGWASGIHDGDYGAQQLEFLVEADSPDLFGGLLGFGGQPYIEANGALAFRGALNASGDTRVHVRLRDDGGRLYGGQDTSATVTFTIHIDPGCDEGAGELFSAGQFDFTYELRDVNRASLDGVLAGVGEIPLHDSVSAGASSAGNTPLLLAKIHNPGPTPASDVVVDLQLRGYGKVLSVDPACQATTTEGAYRCTIAELPVGETALKFRLRNGSGVSAEARFHVNDADRGAQSGGGGSSGLLFLLLGAIPGLFRHSRFRG